MHMLDVLMIGSLLCIVTVHQLRKDNRDSLRIFFFLSFFLSVSLYTARKKMCESLFIMTRQIFQYFTLTEICFTFEL